MSSTCRLSVAGISAGGGTTGPVWDWVRISIVRLAGAGSKPFGGYANETRHSSPLFGNRPDRQLPKKQMKCRLPSAHGCLHSAIGYVTLKNRRDLARRQPAQTLAPSRQCGDHLGDTT